MNWDKAPTWQATANEDKEPEWFEPNWNWDCGLKLDFDGGLLRVSSRFYQTNDDIFDGTVSFVIGDDTIFQREFSSRNIEVLRNDVEKYCREVRTQIAGLLRSNLSTFIEREQEL